MTSDKDIGKALLDLARREAAFREALYDPREEEKRLQSRREAERGPVEKPK